MPFLMAGLRRGKHRLSQTVSSTLDPMLSTKNQVRRTLSITMSASVATRSALSHLLSSTLAATTAKIVSLGSAVSGPTISSTLDATLSTVSQVRRTLLATISVSITTRSALSHLATVTLAGATAKAVAISSRATSTLAATTAKIVSLGSAVSGPTVSSTLDATSSASAHVQHYISVSLSSALDLTSAMRAHLAHTVQSTTVLGTSASAVRHLVRSVQSTLALGVTLTQRSLAHRMSSTLALASRKTARIAHALGSTLAPSARTHSLISTIVEQTVLALTSAHSALQHAFAPAIQEALSAVRNLAMVALARSIQLVAAPRTQVRPAVYSALERTVTLTAAWKETTMLATPVRATDAPPYISPDEHNVAFSVDLSAALGSLTVSTATLIHAVARYPDQSDVQAISMPTFVETIVLSGGNAISVVCGDGTQVEGQTIEVAIALHLATTPIAIWEVYLELPCRKGAQD